MEEGAERNACRGGREKVLPSAAGAEKRRIRKQIFRFFLRILAKARATGVEWSG